MQVLERTDLSAEMRQCIENCLNCHAICLATVTHCLQMGGAHAEVGHIRLLLDCANSCQTSADFMLRNSPMHSGACGFCAEVCRMCAEDCERLAGDDAQMKACAEMCRKCEQSCRAMSGH